MGKCKNYFSFFLVSKTKVFEIKNQGVSLNTYEDKYQNHECSVCIVIPSKA